MTVVAKKTVKTAEHLTRQLNGTIGKSSLNREARTVNVVFATATPVLMGWYDRYYEVLSFEPAHVRMERLNSGAPVLDMHNRWVGAADQPGVVESATIANGQGEAVLRFSKNENGTKLMEQVADGIVRNISFGYRVYGYEEIDAAGTQSDGVAKENKIPTYRAIDWEGNEISFVTIPADFEAGVRTQGGGQQREQAPAAIEINTTFLNNNDDMKRKLHRNSGADGENGGGGTPAPIAAPAAQQDRGAGTPAPAAAPAAPPAPAAAPAAAAADGARSFGDVKLVVNAMRAAGLTHEEEQRVLSASTSLDNARELILGELAARSEGAHPPASPNRATVINGGNERQTRVQGLADSIMYRLFPESFKDGKPSELGRNYIGMNMQEVARDCVDHSLGNGSSRGMSRKDIAQNALNIGDNLSERGAMSTSDLPLALGNVANRVLQQSYAELPSAWRQLASRKNATDFRPMNLVKTGGLAPLEQVLEGGEYKRGTFNETGDSHRVYKYGNITAITWEAIVNDDLGVFDTVLPEYAAAARRTQDNIFWEMFIGGANGLGSTMYDGKQLFHADHLNTLTGSAMSIDEIGKMRAIIRRQKDDDGRKRLNLEPAFMIVGPELEQKALQFSSNAYQATLATDQNVWAGSFKTIVESRFDDYDPNAWYMAAAPNRVKTFVYSFLEGESELFSERRIGFDVDGIEIKVRMVFGTKALDWRGLVRNANVS